MRTFSVNFTNALALDTVHTFVLIEIDFPSGIRRFTDLPYDVSVSGNTYLSSGIIQDYSSPRYSTNVDREIYSITLSDLDNSLLAEAATGLTGRDIRVKFGVMDTNKVPFLSPADLVDGYIGTIDGVTFTNDFEQKLVKIEGASPMADLDLVNGIVVSPDGMDQYSATDTSFDTVLDSEEVQLRWGKT